MNTKEGYILVDHRASPGLPEDIAIASGYDPKLCGEGKMYESKTLTCGHCKIVLVKNLLRFRPRETCAKCGHHYICDVCAFRMTLADYSHLPYCKFIDLALDGQLGTLAELLKKNGQA